MSKVTSHPESDFLLLCVLRGCTRELPRGSSNKKRPEQLRTVTQDILTCRRPMRACNLFRNLLSLPVCVRSREKIETKPAIRSPASPSEMLATMAVHLWVVQVIRQQARAFHMTLSESSFRLDPMHCGIAHKDLGPKSQVIRRQSFFHVAFTGGGTRK